MHDYLEGEMFSTEFILLVLPKPTLIYGTIPQFVYQDISETLIEVKVGEGNVARKLPRYFSLEGLRVFYYKVDLGPAMTFLTYNF